MRRVAGLITAVCVAYAVAVVVWQVLRLAFGDRWWWLAAANVLSLYLFLPLVALIPLALLSRRRVAIVAAIVPLVIFLVLYGGLYLPRIAPARANGSTALKVMTLNVLYTNDDGAAVERLVEAESPDVICLQELTPRIAADLESRLSDEYPYRVLRHREGVLGLGVFSRYPLQDQGLIPDPIKEVTGWWEHSAQVVAVKFEGVSVWLLNIHALSPEWPTLSRQWPGLFEYNFWLRELEIEAWLDWIAQHEGPVIVAGDFNVTDQNKAHQLMSAQLQDAYRQVGWGLGHTAPASPAGLDQVPSPSRLFRIDYVWHSDHWQALDARVGDWDGQSDHLPVLATLILR
jgi:endonuclease/exonuclease/phosphatase (EEP) superfamily protein YafD